MFPTLHGAIIECSALAQAHIFLYKAGAQALPIYF